MNRIVLVMAGMLMLGACANGVDSAPASSEDAATLQRYAADPVSWCAGKDSRCRVNAANDHASCAGKTTVHSYDVCRGVMLQIMGRQNLS